MTKVAAKPHGGFTWM